MTWLCPSSSSGLTGQLASISPLWRLSGAWVSADKQIDFNCMRSVQKRHIISIVTCWCAKQQRARTGLNPRLPKGCPIGQVAREARGREINVAWQESRCRIDTGSEIQGKHGRASKQQPVSAASAKAFFATKHELLICLFVFIHQNVSCKISVQGKPLKTTVKRHEVKIIIIFGCSLTLRKKTDKTQLNQKSHDFDRNFNNIVF